jgi:hypothetical protein
MSSATHFCEDLYQERKKTGLGRVMPFTQR